LAASVTSSTASTTAIAARSFWRSETRSPERRPPTPVFAYQNGGLYEVLLALAIFAVAWPLRHRLRRPGDLTWLVLALFAAGRFFALCGSTHRTN
jgi:prolipoprotein diacylglyceryltransferase